MAIENANDHPYKVAIVKDSKLFANSHPYKVQIEGGGGSEARVVDELPETGESGYIYLVLKETTKEGDIYDEYIWALQPDGETYGWEHIGATNEVTIKLYDTTGQNTDGAMTQKATTDALNEVLMTQSDWEENSSTSPAYIKNRTHHTNLVETTIERYDSTSAGSTPDAGYVWFIEKVEDYALSNNLAAETGDSVYVTITYSVNGVERTDGAKFTASIEDDNLSLDSDAEAGNRWRGAYASELDGDTTFRWPVAAVDASSTVYITEVDYEIVKELDAKYIPVDGDTVKVNAEGKLEADVEGGPTVVQTTGTSTTDVMSQNATTEMVFADPSTRQRVLIGGSVSGSDGSVVIGKSAQGGSHSNADVVIGASAYAYNGSNNVAIGSSAKTLSNTTFSMALGAQSSVGNGVRYAVALGAYSTPSRQGEVNVGTGTSLVGYNSTTYRVIGGVHDGVDTHDAVTVGQLNAVAPAFTNAEFNSIFNTDLEEES